MGVGGSPCIPAGSLPTTGFLCPQHALRGSQCPLRGTDTPSWDPGLMGQVEGVISFEGFPHSIFHHHLSPYLARSANKSLAVIWGLWIYRKHFYGKT